MWLFHTLTAVQLLHARLATRRRLLYRLMRIGTASLQHSPTRAVGGGRWLYGNWNSVRRVGGQAAALLLRDTARRAASGADHGLARRIGDRRQLWWPAACWRAAAGAAHGVDEQGASRRAQAAGTSKRRFVEAIAPCAAQRWQSTEPSLDALLLWGKQAPALTALRKPPARAAGQASARNEPRGARTGRDAVSASGRTARERETTETLWALRVFAGAGDVTSAVPPAPHACSRAESVAGSR